MDPVVTVLLLGLLLVSLWRLKRTYRSGRGGREEDIRSRLAELRKKRDEE